MSDRRRLSRLLAGGLVAAGAVAAIVLVNLLLLRSTAAGHDPVGRLSPRANLPAAPAYTVRPATGRIEDGGADD